MYIAQAFKYAHEPWRYALGGLLIFLASQLGAIPLLVLASFKLMSQGGSLEDLEDPNTIMTILDSNLTLFLMLLSFAIGLVVLVFIVRFLHKQPLISVTTSRSKTDWGRVWFGFGLIAVTTIVLTTIDYNQNPQDYVLQFDLIPFLILAVIAIVMVPLQTSFEEYLFRGYLMQGIGVSSVRKYFPVIVIYSAVALLGYLYMVSEFTINPAIQFVIVLALIGLIVLLILSKMIEPITGLAGYKKLQQTFNSRFLPLVITSVIFGGLHFFNPEVAKIGNIIMLYYIGTGFLLGIMTLMDEGMELALGFHAGNNLVAALLVTADWTVFQTHSVLKDVSEPSAGFDVLLPVLVVYPVFLLIMAWRYKWTNWKEKLFGRIHPPPEEITSVESTI
jgi:membrane protease YdiL (CAAX protease family)